jgi:hypothetical protein
MGRNFPVIIRYITRKSQQSCKNNVRFYLIFYRKKGSNFIILPGSFEEATITRYNVDNVDLKFYYRFL